jgi:hypothetical protein
MRGAAALVATLGVLAGPATAGAQDRSAATGARWEFYDELRSVADRSKVPFQPASDSTARYVVEVVGELTPEWLARRWGSKYTRVLQIFRLVSVRSTTDGRCATS